MASNIVLNRLSAQTGKSKFEANGLIDYILADDMLIKANTKLQVFLDDFLQQ